MGNVRLIWYKWLSEEDSLPTDGPEHTTRGGNGRMAGDFWIGRKPLNFALPFLASFFLALASCSSFSQPPGGYGEPHLMAQANGKKPEWIDQPGKYQEEHRDARYFSGLANREPDQEGGRTDSYANALQNIAQSVANTVDSRYMARRMTILGSNANGGSIRTRRRITNLVRQSAEARLSGVRVVRYWWRKYWIQQSSNAPSQTYYDFYVLVSLSDNQYDRLLRHALSDAKNAASDPQTKRALDLLNAR